MRNLACAGLLLGLCGCLYSIGPSVAERTADELGPYPEHYQEIVLRWIEDEFRAYSQLERHQIAPPRPGVAKPPLLSLRSSRYGWWTRVSFHARDRIGAPTGRIVYALLIRDGDVVRHQKLLR
jgi:hypothetical protein